MVRGTAPDSDGDFMTARERQSNGDSPRLMCRVRREFGDVDRHKRGNNDNEERQCPRRTR